MRRALLFAVIVAWSLSAYAWDKTFLESMVNRFVTVSASGKTYTGTLVAVLQSDEDLTRETESSSEETNIKCGGRTGSKAADKCIYISYDAAPDVATKFHSGTVFFDKDVDETKTYLSIAIGKRIVTIDTDSISVIDAKMW